MCLVLIIKHKSNNIQIQFIRKIMKKVLSRIGKINKKYTSFKLLLQYNDRTFFL